MHKMTDEKRKRLTEEEKREKEREQSRLRAKKWRLLNKEKHVQYTREWRKNNPVKAKAHSNKNYATHKHIHRVHGSIYNAVSSGKLIKPLFCELCGKEELLHGHHEDYNNRLLVKWLCRNCHALMHKKSKPLDNPERSCALAADFLEVQE